MPEQDKSPFAPPAAAERPSRGRDPRWWSCSWWQGPCSCHRFLTQSAVEPCLLAVQGAVDNGELVKSEDVTITTTTVQGVVSTKDGPKTWLAIIPPGYDPTALVDQLSAQGYKVTGSQPNAFAGFIVQTVLFIALFGGLYYFLFRRIGGGATSALNLGRNKVKIYDRKEMKTTFADVAGVDEAKEELREIVDFLKNPKNPAPRRPDPRACSFSPPAAGRRCGTASRRGNAVLFMSGSESSRFSWDLALPGARSLPQATRSPGWSSSMRSHDLEGRAGVSGASAGTTSASKPDRSPQWTASTPPRRVIMAATTRPTC